MSRASLLAVLSSAVVACTGPSSTVGPAEAPTPLAAAPEQDWPMFRDDVERSGFAEGSTVGANVERLWSIPKLNTTGYGAVKGSPSVVGDLVYCGTDTGRFLAAHIDDGSIVWQVQLTHTTHGIHGSPAIVGDYVYIGAYDGTVYAFERRSGLLAWRYRLGYQVGSSPAVVPEWGVVYSAHEESPDGGGFVVSLDARTGRELWRSRTEAHPHSSIAVDVDRRALFVGDNRGNVYALDARTGAERWTRELVAENGKADVKTTPTVLRDRGLVVVGAWSGKLTALDEASGAIVWENEAGGHMMGSPAYLASAATVYLGTPDGRLLAVNADSGITRWTYATKTRVMSSPAVSGDARAVVFGAGDGNVYAVRADTGALLWSIHVGGQVTGSPTLVGDRIYVTSHRGGLWALTTHD